MTLQRLTVVVNPRGGRKRGLSVLECVMPVFRSAGVDLNIQVTQHPGHASEIARSLDTESCDAICVVGGDGTLHEVADGLMQRGEPVRIPLGVIPAGTGNTLAEHLQCKDVIEAARRIIDGRSQALDVVRITSNNQEVHCIDLVGWGAVSDINCNAEQLRWMGPSRYSAAALWQILRAKRRRATLTLDGCTIDDEFIFVAACNPRFAGPGMMLAPHAELGDGKVDVVVVRNASRRDMLKLFNRVFDGSHLALRFVEYHQVRSFAIVSQTNDALDLDGEIKGNTPMSAEVLPAALSILT